MTALAQDQTPRAFAQGYPRHQRRPANAAISTGFGVFLTSMCMSVNGNAQPCLSGTAMQNVCKSFAGGDANSGVFVSSRQAAVRVALVSGAAESIAFAYNGTQETTDISITYNNGTSTPNSLCNLVRGNAEADRLLRIGPSGTGAGTALVAAALAAVPFITMLGVPTSSADNTTGASPLALPPSFAFDVGWFGAQADPANPPVLNGVAYIIDDNTFSAAVDPLALQCPIRLVDARGLTYGDLSEAR